MRFTSTPIPGAHVIELQPAIDARGYFARAFDRDAFAAGGLMEEIVQVNLSYNERKGTLRGMHLQGAPHEEAKVVGCVRGAVYDVIVDLRRDSPTHRDWFAVELRADDSRMLHVPAGVAHGFQALADDTELLYLMSAAYVPTASLGVRWDDPAFGIEWPDPQGPRVISQRDCDFADYAP